MRSFALSAGKTALFIALLWPQFVCAKSEFSYWTWGTVTAATIIGVSQLDDSEVSFASLYAGGALYTMHARDKYKETVMEDYIIPMGFVSMALLNLTALKQEDRSPTSIIFYNSLGVAAIASYWYYFENETTTWGLTPIINKDYQGLVAQFEF